MKRLLTLLALLSGMALGQAANYGGSVNVASFSANCIPLAVTAATLQCGPLFSPDANTVQQSNTTNVQSFQLYGTTDSNASPTNYERITLKGVSGNSFQLLTEKGGTGTLRGIDIFVGAGNALGIGNTGRTLAITANSGLITTYGGSATVAQGLAPIRGTQSLTAQTANLAATNLVTSAGAGLYRVCFNAATTTSGTGTTATVGVIWTDAGGVKTFTSATWALNAVDVTGQVNGCQIIRSAASQNIQISVTGTFGTSVYRIDATAETLQ